MRSAWLVMVVAATACSFDPPNANTPKDAGAPRDAGAELRDAGFADGGDVDGGAIDAGRDGGEVRDGGEARDGGDVRDGGEARDGGDVRDGGEPRDGGEARDGGEPRDGGAIDGGVVDGGTRDGGPRDGGQPVATEIIFLTPNPTIAAGGCSTPLRVQRRDANGIPANDPVPLTLFFNHVGVPTTFHNPGCAIPQLTAITIPPGASEAQFAVSGTLTGNATLLVTSPGFNDLFANLTVVPGPVASIAFTTGSQSVPWRTCSSEVRIERRDAFDNPAAPTSSTSLTLSEVPPGSVVGYLDAACTMPSTTFEIPSGSSSTGLYFEPQAFATVVLEVASPGLATISQSETVADCPALCSAQCATCCLVACPGGGAACSPICGNSACPCELDCDTSSSCNASCGNSDCGIDCPAGAPCSTTCAGTSSCVVDCRASSSCDVSCTTGSQCLILCPPGGCTLNCPTPTNCGNGVFTCQAACP